MNREILFRAKCSGVWRYGSHVHFDKKPIHDCYNAKYRDFIVVNGVYGENHYPITEFSSIGQYTGLKDKNGKKIFEGDIIKLKDFDVFDEEYKEIKGVVEYSVDRFIIVAGKIECDLSVYYDTNCKIIGNTTDTPELMK